MPMASGHLTLTLWPMLGTDTAEPTPDTGTDMALGTTAKGPLIPRPFSTVDPEGLTFAFSMFAKISRLVHQMALSKFSGNKVFKIVSYIRLISKIHTLSRVNIFTRFLESNKKCINRIMNHIEIQKKDCHII